MASDKLETLPQGPDTSTGDVDRLNEMAWQRLNSDPNEAIQLSDQALEIAERLNYPVGKAYSWRNAAAARWMLADNAPALEINQQALSLFEELGDQTGQIDALTIFAAIYGSLCEYDAALDYQLKALSLAEETDNKNGISKALSNIGAIYYVLGQYEISLDYQIRRLQIDKELGNPSHIASALSSVGDLFLKLNEPQKARDYQNRALEIAGSLDNQYDVAHIYQNVGLLYESLAEHQPALSYLLKALYLFENIGNKVGMAETLMHVGSIYCAEGQFEDALASYDRALDMSSQIRARDLIYQIHEAYSRVFERMGDLVSALEHFKLYDTVKSEVLNSDNQKAIAGMQIRFNAEKARREREIFRLRNVELVVALEKVAAANQEIETLNSRLKAENRRMSAELDISRQVQQMNLPRPHELREVPGLDIAAYMVPAHEVGGDYYDVLQQDGRVKIGIGDVTGHGLESGVLSLMVQTAVRTLVVNEETDPVRFTQAVNKVIFQNVQRMQSDKTLTLLLLDYQAGWLGVTGQHEELIIIRRDGAIEVIDTLDLGFPIGLEPDISPFVAHRRVRLEAGDLALIYTDGITEAENAARQQYGLEQLCAVAQAHHTKRAEEIKDAVIADVLAFIGSHKIYDDITLLVLKQL